jgi:hypothetical protein
MATEARYEVPKTLGAPTNPANSGPALTPEEFAEFIDSLREDEIAAEAADGTESTPSAID